MRNEFSLIEEIFMNLVMMRAKFVRYNFGCESDDFVDNTYSEDVFVYDGKVFSLFEMAQMHSMTKN